MMPSFPQNLLQDRDRPFLTELGSQPVQPIFIMGLHRSGTTFLYETLHQLLPVAGLSVYELVFYSRLLHSQREGTSAQQQAQLDRYFLSLGLQTRPTDQVPLSHAALEEYGWLLMRLGRSFYLSARTLPLFEQICRKLLYLQPRAQAVLMKSPWDAGLGAAIHRLLPQARFIYLQRDPLEILNSQFKNALLFGSRGDPFLMLLMNGIPLGRAVIRGQQLLYHLAGEERYRRIMLRHLIGDVQRELTRSHQALAGLPPALVCRVDYGQLMQQPREVLQRVIDFLGLPLQGPLEAIQPQPRHLKLFPEIAARQEELTTHFQTGQDSVKRCLI